MGGDPGLETFQPVVVTQHAEVLVTRGPGDRVPGPKRHEQKEEGAALTT